MRENKLFLCTLLKFFVVQKELKQLRKWKDKAQTGRKYMKI